MNQRVIWRVIGGLLLFLAAAQMSPLAIAVIYQEDVWSSFLFAALTTAAIGAALYHRFRNSLDTGIREGFAIVAFGWTSFGLLGSLPYLFSGVIDNPIDAFFETVSGFTTTGSSIVASVEVLPKSILFWRSLTQFIGGMGIIVLSLAILPLLGVGGMQLFGAEITGPTKDRLTPRIQDTARALWLVYVSFFAICALAYTLGGMSIFDAICHAMTTISTGGFSTSDQGIAAWDNSIIQISAILFMFVGGINFNLHFLALRHGHKVFWRNEEFRWYLTIVLFTGTTMTLVIASAYNNIALAARDAFFNTVSILTTTGYSQSNFETWPVFAQALLLMLMVIGGSSGSTAGAVKITRIIVLVKYAQIQAFRLLHPRALRFVKLEGKSVAETIVYGILGFIVVYFLTASLAILAITASGVDLITATTGVLAAIGNVGPGLGEIGPSENYASLPDFSKIVLTFCMLLGRLELFTILVLFFPSAWRR